MRSGENQEKRDLRQKVLQMQQNTTITFERNCHMNTKKGHAEQIPNEEEEGFCPKHRSEKRTFQPPTPEEIHVRSLIAIGGRPSGGT